MCRIPLLQTILFVTILIPMTASSVLSGPPDREVNPYPETPEEIASYRKHLIKTYHEQSHYSDQVINISSLKELAEYAGKSEMHVRMKPGVYEVTVDNYKQFVKKGLEDRHTLFLFNGTNSYFDLKGVEIKTDSGIPALIGGGKNYSDVKVDGKNLILEGLTVTNVGNDPSGPAGHVSTFSVRGEKNLFHGLRLYTRGSRPYGYVDGRTPYAHWGISSQKRASVNPAGGSNNVYVDFEIFQRASGHALAWSGKGDMSNTFINCRIDGQVRMTDDILNRTEGGFFTDRAELPEEFDLSKHLQPGRLTELSEDIFRSYGTPEGTLKILGCQVFGGRDAVKRGNFDIIFISNTRFHGVMHGPFLTTGSERTEIVNCEVDLLSQHYVRLFGGTGVQMDVKLVPPSQKILPQYDNATKRQAIRNSRTKSRSGLIKGQGHKISLRGDKESLRVEEWFPLKITGERIRVRNETGLPILLTKEAQDCRIITNGEVTDRGRQNQIQQVD